MLYILLLFLAFVLFVMWCCFKVGSDFDNNIQICQKERQEK